jgi:predicted NBD/HSP70 family sugar kinase
MSALHRSQGSSVALLERLVLASFASGSGLTRRELEEQTGLSRTVVSGVVASLVHRGELAETLQPPTGGGRGRPPARYQRTALLPPVLLINLRKDRSTSISSLRGDGTGSEALHCAPWSEEWRTWSRSVLEAAGRLRTWSRLPPRLAVLSAPFPVAEARGAPRGFGVVLEDFKATGRRVPPRPAWLEKDPRPDLSDLLGCTALMVNDANLAALGEAWFGAGRGRRAVLHICVADGIGAGFVFGGRLFTGAHGFSGELAHVQVNPEGPACVCGNRGCLITHAVVRGLRGHLTAGNMAELGSLVGCALAPLVTMLDPDCIVVDARLAAGCRPFIAGATAELHRRCPPDLAGTLMVVAGELDDAERYGALAAADAHAAALVSALAIPRPADLFMNNQHINRTALCGGIYALSTRN